MLLNLLYFAAATITQIQNSLFAAIGWVELMQEKKKLLWTTSLGIHTTSDYQTQAYRVGVSTVRFPSFFSPFLDALGSYPFLKRFIVKVNLTLCSSSHQCHKVLIFKYERTYSSLGNTKDCFIFTSRHTARINFDWGLFLFYILNHSSLAAVVTPRSHLKVKESVLTEGVHSCKPSAHCL